jgi:NADH-quinone oxidoreductase subunit G
MDAVGSAIRVDSRGREVMRIMPRVNEQVNEEWISDKTRFIWDGLRTQRLDRPYVRRDGKLVAASWGEAFAAIKEAVAKTSGDKIGAIAGDLAAVEEMYALKLLMQSLASPNIDCRQDGAALNPALGRASYIFNPTIEGIEQADTVLIVGANPRFEASVLNARIRKRWKGGPLPIGVIGEVGDLRYDYEMLGAGAESLNELAAGRGKFFSVLKSAKRPLIIVGQGALARSDGAAVLGLAAKLALAVDAVSAEWNGFAVLHTAAARVGGLDIGFVPGEGGKRAAEMASAMDVLFLLGADEIDMTATGGAFVVYIGTHGDAGAHRANVILPGAAYAEKSGIYVNTEGRVQQTNRAGFAPGEAREDWAILRALSDVLGHKLPFDSLSQLRARLTAGYPHFVAIDEIAVGDPADIQSAAQISGPLAKGAFASPMKDFYLTNPIARASAVMAECSALAKGGFKQAAE